MIKPEELSIGDWVFMPQKNDFTKYTQGQIEAYDLFYGRIIDCKPIHITSEILEKNGFVLESDGWVYYKNPELKEQDYICVSFRHNGETRRVEINFMHKAQCVFRHIYYVHELQHALKLCGIHKNIEL